MNSDKSDIEAPLEESDESQLTDEETGRFVRRIKHSSEDETDISGSSEDEKAENAEFQDLKKRYEDLLKKFENERCKKKMKKPSRRRETITESNSSKSLADRIRGWQMMELERLEDHKAQYHAWLAFKSSAEANWKMYGVTKDCHKLICLQTKCKGFVVELINSIHRVKPTFEEVWNGLQTQFYAPIDSGEETSYFYQMKQLPSENIFNFFERVAKQAYLCDFSESECAKRIGELFSRNCLNPAFFLGKIENFDDLDKLKNHARNFHAALPKFRQEPVLAINHQQFSGGMKRKFESNFDGNQKRRHFEPRKQENNKTFQVCNYCGEQTCNKRNCPARGKRCNYCLRFDHFEKACFKKKTDNRNSHNDNTVNAVTVAKEEDVKVCEH